MKKFSLLLSAGLLLLAPAATRAQTDADPLDAVAGQWLGDVGTPLNHAEWGIEIKRDAHGAMKGYLYQSIMNFYGLELGAVTFADGVYTLPGFGWPVKLVDGRLVAENLGSLKMSVNLGRTDRLPAEVPVPDFPRGPEPRWQTRLGGGIYAPVAVRDGVAYVGTTGGTFNAVSLKDGAITWAFPAGRPVHGEALVTDEHVYFACDNGFLFKLSRADGKEVWKYDLGDAQAPRVLMHQTIFFWDYKAPKPALADGILYLGAGDGGFHAINAETGQRVWRFSAKDRIRTNALVHGDKIYFGSFDGHFYCVTRADGTEVWKRKVGAVNASPTLVDGHVAFGTRGTTLSVVAADTGEPVWRSFMWGSSAESSLIQFGEFAYTGASDLRRITAVEAKTGRVLWREDIFGIAWGNPVVTEKIIYAAAGGYEPYQMRHVGGLSALDRATGQTIWRWPAPRAPHQYESGFAAGPVLAGDTLVIGSMDGTLYAFPLTE